MTLLSRRGLLAGTAGLAVRGKRRRKVAMYPDEQGVFPFVIVGGSGSASGVFVYDPTIAAGNLIASMTDSLTSPTGDTTVKGVTSYDPVTGRYAELNGSALALNSTAAGSFIVQAASLHLTDALAAGTNPSLTLDSPQASLGAAGARIILIGPNHNLSGPAAQVVVGDQGVTGTLTAALLEVRGTLTTTNLNSITADGDLLTNVGNVKVLFPGQGLQVKEGANAKQGRATLVAGTVTIANTSVTATSIIVVGTVTPSANPGAPFVKTKTAGTGFVVNSTNAADTAVIGYQIFEAP